MKLCAACYLWPGIFLGTSFSGISGTAETNGRVIDPVAVVSNLSAVHASVPAPAPIPGKINIAAPKVLLSGFYKVGTNTHALLVMPPKDKNGATKYFNLSAGEQDAPVEVVKINPSKGEVEIINSGTPMTLSLAKNGLALSAPENHEGGGAVQSRNAPGVLPESPAPVTLPSIDKNSVLVAGGGDSASLRELNNVLPDGGAIVAGGSRVGAEIPGAYSSSRSGLPSGGVGSAGALYGNNPNVGLSAATAGAGTVYVPPVPASSALSAAQFQQAVNPATGYPPRSSAR